jgi:preprotein translocase subunit SecD
MDRSLRWRTVALVFATLFCVAVLAPTFLSDDAKDSLPRFWPLNHVFGSEISYGTDLKGGKRIIYQIDLNRAVDDKASEIKRDLDARFADDKIDATVRLPNQLGAVSVLVTDAKKRDEITGQIESDYGSIVSAEPCPEGEPTGSMCFVVSSAYAESIKRAALTNAVQTIRDRINESGVAEPSVVEKGDDIIVELPGDPESENMKNMEGLIARTAKLEMKVVDDCSTPSPQGCIATSSAHEGSPYMRKLVAHVSDKKGNVIDPDAKSLDVRSDVDTWKPEDGSSHSDLFLLAYDREETVPVEWARKHGKLRKDARPENGKVRVQIDGWQILDRYLHGDKDLGVVGLMNKEPACDPNAPTCFRVPDDHELAYEVIEPPTDARDQRKYWRTYYLEKAVRLTGTSISDARPAFDPSTNRPVVELTFNRFGGRVFGDVTAQIVGMRFATLLDGKVRSAPTIETAIRGGSARITMGGGDPVRAERERDDLVAVLKTGSLPAPLVEQSVSNLGPTLGRDAIDKTRNSFIIGILLVILIMVGIYRWSGWIAVFAVVFHIVMTLAVMALFGATLTLPGIAAIVLSIGMEVDGNILIYERIRDELLLGKSVRGAIDLGFSRAFSAILDGQLTTAAAAWVLLQYGSGPIKGFAVMMLVGVFTTLTTNIWVTRIFFDWAVARKKGPIQTLSI